MSLKPDALPALPTPLAGGGQVKPGAASADARPATQVGGQATGGLPAAPGGASVVRWSTAVLAHGPQAPGAPAVRLAWPSAGLGGATLGQAAQLLHTLSQVAPATPKPVLPLAAQAWSPGFLAQWLAEGDAPGASRPPLQDWATQHLQVQTPGGQHSLVLRLLFPAGRLPGEAPAAQPAPHPAAAAGGTQAAVLRWPDSPLLQAGALAWVLAPEDQAAVSALMVLEWGPRREAVVYGKEGALTRHDPWVLQAQWLATGVKERPRAPGHGAPLCDTPDCPYRGLAACPQPFCPATGAVAAVAPA